MGPGELVFMIPITAIVLGIGSGIIQSILKSQERRLEMRLRLQQGRNDEAAQQIEALRAEVARLRDTSTQFDMSLEETVHRLESRMEHVEAKTAGRVSPVPEETTQHVGRH